MQIKKEYTTEELIEKIQKDIKDLSKEIDAVFSNLQEVERNIENSVNIPAFGEHMKKIEELKKENAEYQRLNSEYEKLFMYSRIKRVLLDNLLGKDNKCIYDIELKNYIKIYNQLIETEEFFEYKLENNQLKTVVEVGRLSGQELLLFQEIVNENNFVEHHRDIKTIYGMSQKDVLEKVSKWFVDDSIYSNVKLGMPVYKSGCGDHAFELSVSYDEKLVLKLDRIYKS